MRTIALPLPRHGALLVATLAPLFAACGGGDGGEVITAEITATGETDGAVGDPDDPAVWVAGDPSRSRIIGTDKHHGLYVYDLHGTLLQDLPDGAMNSVDLRPFDLGGRRVSLVTAGNRTDNTIAFYAIDDATAALTRIAPLAGLATGLTVYGSCMGRAPDGSVHMYFDDKLGHVVEWRLGTGADGAITATELRRLQIPTQPENCVVDDELGRLYVGEEDAGIWRFDAFGASTEGTLIAQADGVHLVADVEGLTLMPQPGRGGYLIASSQGDNAYALFRRIDNRFMGRFRIVDGAIDAATESDGIDVTPAALPGFPGGMFLAHDTSNDGGNGNFKLVPWDDVLRAVLP